MRNAETQNELCNFSLAIVITSRVNSYALMVPENGTSSAAKIADPVSLAELLVVTALGYILHSIQERLGAWSTMNSSIKNIVPCDVGIEMMSFGLLLELSF